MRRILIMSIVLLSIFALSNAQKLNKLTKAEKKAGWELLYNGKNLNGWKSFQGGEVSGWKVIDGILHNSGIGSDHGGDIITLNQYQDFELYLEWKIAPESNSGVFIRVQEGETEKMYETGPEYQLLDDKGWPKKISASQYSGANYAMHAPVGAEVKSLDQWNTTRIVVNGTSVQHFLNEKKVVEYELLTEEWTVLKNNCKWKNKPLYGKAEKGHIGLQDHGGLTQFRNVKIRVL